MGEAEPGPGCHQRWVLGVIAVGGAALLQVCRRVDAGDPSFFWWTVALSGTWLLGSTFGTVSLLPRRGLSVQTLLGPVLVGVLAGAAWLAASLLLRSWPPTHTWVAELLAYPRQGRPLLVAVTVVLAVLGQELFFRGAVFAAIPKRPELFTTVAYAAVSLGSGNPVLVLSSVLLGLLLARQRQVSGALLAPLLTQLTWLVILLLTLPRLYA